MYRSQSEMCGIKSSISPSMTFIVYIPFKTDDIVIAIKNNVLTVRRLYRYQKGIILQAMNPKYPTININIVANNMILGKVTAIYREK